MLNWRSQRVRTWVYQLVLIGILIALVGWLLHNTLGNMRMRGIQSGFDFCWIPRDSISVKACLLSLLHKPMDTHFCWIVEYLARVLYRNCDLHAMGHGAGYWQTLR